MNIINSKSLHSKQRISQRGINPLVVSILPVYSREEKPNSYGATKLVFCKREGKRIINGINSAIESLSKKDSKALMILKEFSFLDDDLLKKHRFDDSKEMLRKALLFILALIKEAMKTVLIISNDESTLITAYKR